MAIVQYTAIVNQLRGKLNGSVFNKARTAYTLQGKQTPNKATTVSQNQNRNLFGQIQRTWKSLTNAQRSNAALIAANHPVRDRLGNLVHISGYNWFIKANMFRVSTGYPIANNLNPAVISTYTFSSAFVQDLSVTGLPGSESMSYDFRFNVATGSAIGLQFSVYISEPVSPGITSFYGNYLLFFSGEIEPGYNNGDTFIYFGSGAVPSGKAQYKTGDTVWVRVLFYTIANGVTYQEYIFQHRLT